MFAAVVSIVRHSFPEPSVLHRGDSSLWLICQKYVGQIISINIAFKQSEPCISGTFNFVELLRDSGYYLMNNGEQPDAISLLETCRTVCMELIKKGCQPARTTLADELGTLTMYYIYMGNDYREKARSLSLEAIALREEKMAGIPPEEWSQLDHVNHGRSYVDMSEACSMLYRTDEARKFVAMAIEHYVKAGGEKSLPARTAYGNSLQLLLNCDLQPLQSLQRSRHYLELAANTVGREGFLTLQIKQFVGVMAMRAGRTEEALEIHKENFELRTKLKGKANHETLASQYCLAVCYQNTGKLGDAE